MLIQCLIGNSSWPCFAFCPVFSSYLESGTGFCTSIAFCFNVCMYLFIWVPLFVLIESAVAER